MKSKDIKKIWIINFTERALSFDDSLLTRHLSVAKHFSENIEGLEILWITSKFNHFLKQDEEIDIRPKHNVRILALKSIGYTRNISFRRVIHHVILSSRLAGFFLKSIFRKERPSIILLSFPPISSAFLGAISSKILRSKCIIDVRDYHPEIFLSIQSVAFKIIAYLTYPFFYLINFFTFNLSNLVISLSEDAIQYLKKHYFLKRKKMTSIPHAYPITLNGIQEFELKYLHPELDLFFQDQDDYVFLMYSGAISSRTKLKKLLRALSTNKDLMIKILITGSGDVSSFVKKMSSIDSRILYLPFQSRVVVSYLYTKVDFGLIPYSNSFDFNLVLPTKFSEILAHGLPIIASSQTMSGRVINQSKLGKCVDLEKDILHIQGFLKKIYKPSSEDKWRCVEYHESYLNQRLLLDGFSKCISIL